MPAPKETPPADENGAPKRNPRSLVFGAAVGLLLLTGLVFWGIALFGPSGKPAASAPPVDNRPVSSAPAQPASAAASAAFARRLLGVWEGKLALFAEGMDTPDEVYDVFISTLPEEEQARLEKGIVVQSEEELAGWLEDYTS